MRRKAAVRLVTLQEQWQAIDLMTEAVDHGELPEDRYRRTLTAIWRSTTPHELWKATGGRIGEKRRGDWAAWRGAVYRVLAIIPLGLAALWVLAWGLRQYYGGR
jgi:hypothetical protein